MGTLGIYIYFTMKIKYFWFLVVLKLDVNHQGSHLLFWHP